MVLALAPSPQAARRGNPGADPSRFEQNVPRDAGRARVLRVLIGAASGRADARDDRRVLEPQVRRERARARAQRVRVEHAHGAGARARDPRRREADPRGAHPPARDAARRREPVGAPAARVVLRDVGADGQREQPQPALRELREHAPADRARLPRARRGALHRRGRVRRRRPVGALAAARRVQPHAVARRARARPAGTRGGRSTTRTRSSRTASTRA